jgi:hypothetical protein
MLAVNGLTATLVVEQRQLLQPHLRADGGRRLELWPELGPGRLRLEQGAGAMDNIAVQVVPPTATVTRNDEFTGGVGPMVTAVAGSSTGGWTAAADRLQGAPTPGSDTAIQLLNLSGIAQMAATSLLEVSTTLKTAGLSGIVFDRYSDTDFKFAAVDTATQRVLIGHRTASGWTVDAAVSNLTLNASTDLKLGLSIKGSTVSVTLNDQAALGYAFNAVGADGRFGLFSRGVSASFDSVTVRTNDPTVFNIGTPPAVSLGDAVLVEAGSGQVSSATLTLTLSAPATSTTTVDWATVSGTATAGVDFEAASGTVSFAAGSTTAQITVPILGDGQWEADESFTVVLSNPVGLTIADADGVVTIQNDDAQPVVSVTVLDGAGAETGRDPISFQVTRSANTVGLIVVDLGWSGTATFGSDYTLAVTGGTLSADGLRLTLNDGASSALISVIPVDDSLSEAAEGVTLTLKAGSGYAVGTATASGTIADNDLAQPVLAIASTSVVEGSRGTTTVAVTVTLSAPSTSTVKVNYTTSNGTAIAGSDYQATSGTLSFAPGVTSLKINVSVVADKIKEPNETFSILLSNPIGAVIGTASATVTILDDERALTASSTTQDAQALSAGSVASGPTIDEGDLQVLAAEALRRMPLSDAQRAQLGAISISVEDLPGLAVGEFRDGSVLIDVDAAGNGWFVDMTPTDDAEFVRRGGLLLATDGDASGRMDLLSVLAHELGHAAGLEHGQTGLMSETLTVGTRLIPADGRRMPAIGSAFADSAWGSENGAAGMPRIDWGVRPVVEAPPAPAATAPSDRWTGDFTNYLGKSKTEREPNAKISLLVPQVAAKVVSDIAVRLGSLFR